MGIGSAGASVGDGGQQLFYRHERLQFHTTPAAVVGGQGEDRIGRKVRRQGHRLVDGDDGAVLIEIGNLSTVAPTDQIVVFVGRGLDRHGSARQNPIDPRGHLKALCKRRIAVNSDTCGAIRSEVGTLTIIIGVRVRYTTAIREVIIKRKGCFRDLVRDAVDVKTDPGDDVTFGRNHSERPEIHPPTPIVAIVVDSAAELKGGSAGVTAIEVGAIGARVGDGGQQFLFRRERLQFHIAPLAVIDI